MSDTREEAHARQAAHMEAMQKQHPEVDAKLDSAWWKPGIDFSFDVKERLDESTYTKMNAILAQVYSPTATTEEKEKTMEEARECLKAHPDLVARFDDVFGSLGAGFWNTVGKMKQNGNASDEASASGGK